MATINSTVSSEAWSDGSSRARNNRISSCSVPEASTATGATESTAVFSSATGSTIRHKVSQLETMSAHSNPAGDANRARPASAPKSRTTSGPSPQHQPITNAGNASSADAEFGDGQPRPRLRSLDERLSGLHMQQSQQSQHSLQSSSASDEAYNSSSLVSSSGSSMCSIVVSTPTVDPQDIVDEDLNEAQHAAAMAASASNALPGTSGGIRPIYPNVPYSPYGSPYVSPFGSPRIKKRQPFRESRRVSIEHNETFLQLNQYKLYDKIGQGSYGLVKLAYSEEDSTHYAMKIMSKKKLMRKAGLMGRGPKRGTAISPLDRVYREIAVLKKLDHPNVVKLVEVLDDPSEDALYLVFEMVEQGAILSVPTETPLTEERAWSAFRDALLGLEYLHYQHIIHSDLKPDNLLVDKQNRVLIADLGVCNEFNGNDASMSNISTPGTPAFRAPETLQTGQHKYDGRAVDVWALGATLFALVYGKVPFVADNVPALYECIRTAELSFPSAPVISDELRQLLIAMLNKDPEKRVKLPQIKSSAWVTRNGEQPMPNEEENCCALVDVTEDDIQTVVKSIPKLDTLILIKNMLKKHSFQNPYAAKSSTGQARTERFLRAGRSNSAPGAYHGMERQVSSENLLPPVSEVEGAAERPTEEDGQDE